MENYEIKIGVLSVTAGPFSVMGEDGFRGVDLAIEEFGGTVAGKKITVVKEGTNAIPDSAVYGAEALLDRHGVDFTVGPLSGNEGLALRDFAKTRPNVTFINGSSGAQDLTLRSPAPNFFNFFTNGVQWTAGLAQYAYTVQGYRRVATLAEDYSFPHGQVGGFTLQFCRLGGSVVQKFWVPLGTVDYSAVIDHLPPDIDALFVALGGTDGVNFLRQYQGDLPLIGGSLIVEQTTLSKEQAVARRMVGMASGGPIADDNPNPEWQAFVAAYRHRFPRGMQSPSLTAYGFYVNTKAALLALQAVEGDLSAGQTRFMTALSALEFDAPAGRVRLDHHRQAIANNFITVVTQQDNGKLINQLVQVIPEVNNTLDIPEDEYLSIGVFNRDNPPTCPGAMPDPAPRASGQALR